MTHMKRKRRNIAEKTYDVYLNGSVYKICSTREEAELIVDDLMKEVKNVTIAIKEDILYGERYQN